MAVAYRRSAKEAALNGRGIPTKKLEEMVGMIGMQRTVIVVNTVHPNRVARPPKKGF